MGHGSFLNRLQNILTTKTNRQNIAEIHNMCQNFNFNFFRHYDDSS